MSLPYATYGVEHDGERVVDAAPIAAWMIGRPVGGVAAWLDRKGARVVPLPGVSP